MILLWGLSAWVMADFLAGLFHWFEDRVLLKDTGIWWLEMIRTDNGDHHGAPGAILRFSLWENIKMSAFVMWPLCAAALVCGWYWWSLVFLFGSFANMVHRFAHVHPAAQPSWMRALQASGLFISTEQHQKHHYIRDVSGLTLIPKEKTTGYYCVVTGWLNWPLDKIRFFKFLNFICGV